MGNLLHPEEALQRARSKVRGAVDGSDSEEERKERRRRRRERREREEGRARSEGRGYYVEEYENRRYRD